MKNNPPVFWDRDLAAMLMFLLTAYNGCKEFQYEDIKCVYDTEHEYIITTSIKSGIQVHYRTDTVIKMIFNSEVVKNDN